MDTKPLFKKIEYYLKTSNLDFYENIMPEKGRLDFGVFIKGIKDLEIGNFGNGISKDKNNEPYYWTNIHFSYHFLSGGHNGCDINILRKTKDMNGNLSKIKITTKELKQLRKEYSKGTRVELLKMDDPSAPLIDSKGTVEKVDDTGSIIVK